MSIATAPNSDTVSDEQDNFSKLFDEFASGKPAPDPEEKADAVPPDGNGPADKPAAPAPAATEEGKEAETATSGDAKPDGGGQPPEGEAPDQWAGLPDDVRERVVAIERERDEAKHKANSDANRVAALSRKLQQLTAGQSSSASKAQEEKPDEAEEALKGKIEELRKNYGEIADPLITLLDRQKQELSQVRATIDGLNEREQAQIIADETAALASAHPDYEQIAQSTDFAGWLQYQPDNIQRLASSWDARETSVALTLFKAERIEAEGQMGSNPQEAVATPAANAATGARRSQQLDGGRDVRSRPAPSASGPPEDFEAAFKYYENKRRQKALR